MSSRPEAKLALSQQQKNPCQKSEGLACDVSGSQAVGSLCSPCTPYLFVCGSNTQCAPGSCLCFPVQGSPLCPARVWPSDK